MIIEYRENRERFTAVLTGPIRWNDRLLLSGLAQPLRSSLALALHVDCRGSKEQDRGSLAGLLGTCERMALLAGKAWLGAST